MKSFIAPLLKNVDIKSPYDVSELFKNIRRNFFARSAIETAIWDIFSQAAHKPLYQYLGGVRDKVKVGISIGIQKTPDELVKKVGDFLDFGYSRIKIKVKPGFDIQYLDAVRAKYPNIELQVDANSSYTLEHLDILKEFDNYNLALIEQPLEWYDIIYHGKLQKYLKTPICLDECIDTLDDAKKAIELDAARIINIKVARVGGLANAKAISEYAQSKGVGVWCGGMLETDIGQAYNIASASLENYVYANDLMSSYTYFKDNLTIDEYDVNKDSTIDLSKREGMGYRVSLEKLNKYTQSLKTVRL